MNTDHWAKNDMMFILDGYGWVLNKYLQTVCVGPVDNDGNPIPDKDSNTPETCTDEKKDVSKLQQVESIEVSDIHEQNDRSFETSKHPGGRPRKIDEYSRITKWRRKKEKQLSMAI